MNIPEIVEVFPIGEKRQKELSDQIEQILKDKRILKEGVTLDPKDFAFSLANDWGPSTLTLAAIFYKDQVIWSK